MTPFFSSALPSYLRSLEFPQKTFTTLFQVCSTDTSVRMTNKFFNLSMHACEKLLKWSISYLHFSKMSNVRSGRALQTAYFE